MATLLLVLGLSDGRGCLLLDAGAAPVEGALPTAEPLTDAVADHFGLMPRGMMLPGADARASRLERGAATQIVDAVLEAEGMQAIRSRILRGLGRADHSDGRTTLLVDARTAPLRAIPWELLESLRPDESPLAGLRVVRLNPGAARPPRTTSAASIRVLGWCPDRSDPICGRVAADLEETTASLGRTELRWFDPAAPSPPADPARFDVLHIICHGERDLDQVVLRVLPGARASTDTATRLLQSALSRADLVVLDVCHGSAETERALDAPGARFTSAGATACVGPKLPFAADASVLFSRGLYSALDAGETVHDAVDGGRRTLGAALRSPHPSWRWWNPTLLVSDAGVLHAPPPVRRPTAIPALPPAGAGLEPILKQAVEHAGTLGFFGLEHLALALADRSGGARLRGIVAPLQAALDSLEPAAELPHAPIPTPRLVALGTSLPDGFDQATLTAAVFGSPSIEAQLGHVAAQEAARLCAGAAGAETVDSALMVGSALAHARRVTGRPKTDRPKADGLHLEVLGGPDDGRVVVLEVPGQTVGRWDASADPEQPGLLFTAPLPTSRLVSRVHVGFPGGPALDVHRRVRHQRPTAGIDVDVRPGPDGAGRLRLQRGDHVVLRDAVRLVVRHLPGEGRGDV